MSISQPEDLVASRRDDQFSNREDILRPFLEDAALRERRRIEAATALVKDYEDREGQITEDEIRAFQAEWLD